MLDIRPSKVVKMSQGRENSYLDHPAQNNLYFYGRMFFV